MESKRNRYAGNGKNSRKGSNLGTGRDYSYDKEYQSSPEQKRKRAKRNAARAEAVRKGKAKRGDSTDVHHVKSLKSGGGNSKGNLRVISRSSNRAKK